MNRGRLADADSNADVNANAGSYSVHSVLLLWVLCAM